MAFFRQCLVYKLLMSKVLWGRLVMEVREENLNVMLAELLSERGLKALGEVIIKDRGKSPRPDVHIILNGVRIVIEGKKPGRWEELRKKCIQRLDSNICDLCIMVEYLHIPIESLEPTQTELKRALLQATYKVGIATYIERVGLERWLNIPVREDVEVYNNVSFDELLTYVMSAYDKLVREDILGPVISRIENVVGSFARSIEASINVDRLKEVLELREERERDEE